MARRCRRLVLGSGLLRLGLPALLIAAGPSAASAQQSFVNLVGAMQVVTGDEVRLGGQSHVEPDFGIQLFDSAFASGKLRADLYVTRRDNAAVLGHTSIALDEVKAGGLTWSFGAGDVWTPAAMPSLGFSNLFSPPVTLVGARVTAVNRDTSLDVSAGRVTALRNLFGTDTYSVGQEVYQASLTRRQGSRLDLHARGSFVQGAGIQPYATLTDAALSLGGGTRYRLRPEVELVADAGYTRATRRGAEAAEQGASGVLGAHLLLPKGWLQVNAQRLPLGTYPVFNYPYRDRSGVFGLGEYDLGRAVRAYGSVEFTRTGLDPDASEQASVGVPPGTQLRGYAGLRLAVASRSMFSIRLEGGGRDIRPSRFGPGFVTDSTVVTGEWHNSFDRGSVFLRYERRKSADLLSPENGYLQHDAMAQAYLSVSARAQLFALALFSRRDDEIGSGQTLWQLSSGTQFSSRRGYLRIEANAARSADRLTGRVTGRQGVSAGFSSQIGRDTTVGIECVVNRTPLPAVSANPWTTRSLIRVTRSFPFGASGTTAAAGTAVARGPLGGVGGEVFADWNGNGARDPGEEPVDGIAVSMGALGRATTAENGQFSFTGVPVGPRDVALDLSTIPATFDPPAEILRTLEVSRHATSRVAFGLVPLGLIEGAVYRDSDGDGTLGEADTPFDGAVLVLDEGARTEVSKAGRVRFDAVRYGAHSVTLLVGSLPEGSELSGPAVVELTLARAGETPRFTFLITRGKRPEVRKVFPPKAPKPIPPRAARRGGGPGDPQR